MSSRTIRWPLLWFVVIPLLGLWPSLGHAAGGIAPDSAKNQAILNSYNPHAQSQSQTVTPTVGQFHAANSAVAQNVPPPTSQPAAPNPQPSPAQANQPAAAEKPANTAPASPSPPQGTPSTEPPVAPGSSLAPTIPSPATPPQGPVTPAGAAGPAGPPNTPPGAPNTQPGAQTAPTQTTATPSAQPQPAAVPSATPQTAAPSATPQTATPSATPQTTATPGAPTQTTTPGAPPQSLPPGSQPGATTAPVVPAQPSDSDLSAAGDPASPELKASDAQQTGGNDASRGEIIKIIIGVLVILVLVYLAGHPVVHEFERRIGLSQVITSGFPFVLLGLIASLPRVGILTEDVVRQIQPILPFGLGWIGFSLGFQFDVRRFDTMPKGIGPAIVFGSVMPLAAITGACGIILLIERGFGGGIFLRNAMILGTAGMVGVGAVAAVRSSVHDPINRIPYVDQIQQGGAIIMLVVLAAVFRPGSNVGWQLPAAAWIFVTLGLGTALACISYVLLRTFEGKSEQVVLLLGTISLSAGLASYLRLSPIAVCFGAAALLYNLPGRFHERVREGLHHIERPVYLLFLVLAGAMWKLSAWQGWILLPLFVAGRLGGKWLGVILARTQGSELRRDEEHSLAFAPMGALAIAVVVNAQDLYFTKQVDESVSWMVTTVIGGGVLTDIVLQIFLHDQRKRATSQGLSHPSFYSMGDLENSGPVASSDPSNQLNSPAKPDTSDILEGEDTVRAVSPEDTR